MDSRRDDRDRSRSPHSRRDNYKARHDPPIRSRSRSVSRSPPRRHSDRPRSPSPRRRRDDKPGRGGGGFRWKEKRNDHDDRNREDDRRLQRGYREQERRRPRSPFRDGKRDGDREERGAEKPKKEKIVEPTIAPVGEPMIIVNVNDRLGTKAAIPCLASDPISKFAGFLHVGDCRRCLSNRSQELFKAQVAARIGREPHEIMLKRQGERPFKDQLTLEDYGVSSGVQLDL